MLTPVPQVSVQCHLVVRYPQIRFTSSSPVEQYMWASQPYLPHQDGSLLGIPFADNAGKLPTRAHHILAFLLLKNTTQSALHFFFHFSKNISLLWTSKMYIDQLVMSKLRLFICKYITMMWSSHKCFSDAVTLHYKHYK